MSRYFQTLKKLQQQRGEELLEMSSPGVEPSSVGQSPAPEWAPEKPDWAPETPEEVFPELPLAHREAAWGDLIEALRTQSQSTHPTIVVAGVTDVESTRRIMAGLLRLAVQRGISVKVARLTRSQEGRSLSLIASTTEDPEQPWITEVPEEDPGGPRERQRLRLSGSQSDHNLIEGLRSWASESDLMIIEAPGVLSSADTILVAKACDGLAIVVEPSITDRTALMTAVKRAQAADCTIIGLIINGHRESLPRWLRRIWPNS